MVDNRLRGDYAEARAISFLQAQGLQLFDYNFNSQVGELDIIMLNGKQLVFVEVKSGKVFDPVANITYNKRKKIVRTIAVYLNRKSLTDREWRFDVVSIYRGEIEWLVDLGLI